GALGQLRAHGLLVANVREHVNDEQAVRINKADGAAHEDEVAGGKAGPAARDASRDAALTDDLSGLVPGAGDAPRRAHPDFIDRRVLLECIGEAPGDVLVD